MTINLLWILLENNSKNACHREAAATAHTVQRYIA